MTKVNPVRAYKTQPLNSALLLRERLTRTEAYLALLALQDYSIIYAMSQSGDSDKFVSMFAPIAGSSVLYRLAMDWTKTSESFSKFKPAFDAIRAARDYLQEDNHSRSDPAYEALISRMLDIENKQELLDIIADRQRAFDREHEGLSQTLNKTWLDENKQNLSKKMELC